jgi:hypothetical protein
LKSNRGRLFNIEFSDSSAAEDQPPPEPPEKREKVEEKRNNKTTGDDKGVPKYRQVHVVVTKVVEPVPNSFGGDSSSEEDNGRRLDKRRSGASAPSLQAPAGSEAEISPLTGSPSADQVRQGQRDDSAVSRDLRPPPSVGAARTYVCTREKKGALGGTAFFSFHENAFCLYNARFKKTRAEIVAAGKELGRGCVPDCILLTSSKLLDFGLRSELTGCEMLAIRFSFAKGPVENCRRMSVTIFEDRTTPLRLVTRNPALGADGKVVHDFEGRFAVDSVKNAVLIMRSDGPAVVLIRKAGKNVIEIELRMQHEPVWAFAIAIASFLSRAK